MTSTAKHTKTVPEGIELVEARWDVRQHYLPDPTLLDFFDGLKARRILGGKVEQTGRVIVPPQSFCEASYLPVDEMVEVGPGGTIRAFTIVQTKIGNAPPPPLYMVFVQFDGADTASPGYLQNHDLAPGRELSLMGARCKAVFAETPVGDWRDFWFELEG